MSAQKPNFSRIILIALLLYAIWYLLTVTNIVPSFLPPHAITSEMVLQSRPGILRSFLEVSARKLQTSAIQCSSFTQVVSSSSALSIVTTGGTANTYVYALPADCPTVCSWCTAGCLFTSSSGYTGVGFPSKNLAYDTSASGSQGSWLALATAASSCVSGGSVGAVTGSLVTISGMVGKYSSLTGTRVSTPSSSCGQWVLDVLLVTASPTAFPTTAPTTSPTALPTTDPTLSPTISPACVASLCVAGQYIISTSTCAVCPVGKYTSTTSQSSCTPCALGTYNSYQSPGATSTCLPCPAGSYTNTNTGATTCILCPSGQYSAIGATICTPCPAGTYTLTPGLGTCNPCLPGTFSSSGSSICQSCPAHTTSSAFAQNCSSVF